MSVDPFDPASPLSLAARALLALAQTVDCSGLTRTEMAARTGMSRASVFRALAELATLAEPPDSLTLRLRPSSRARAGTLVPTRVSTRVPTLVPTRVPTLVSTPRLTEYVHLRTTVARDDADEVSPPTTLPPTQPCGSHTETGRLPGPGADGVLRLVEESTGMRRPVIDDGQVREVWAAYVAAHDRVMRGRGRPVRPLKLTDLRRELIRRRIRTHGLDEVIAAVTGWEHDPWPARIDHADLETVLAASGQRDNVSRFAAMCKPARPSPAAVPEEDDDEAWAELMAASRRREEAYAQELEEARRRRGGWAWEREAGA